MEPIIVDIRDLLSEPGDHLALSGILDLDGYEMGSLHYEVESPLSYHVTLSNVDNGVFLLGHVEGSVTGECGRCLEPARFELDAETEGFYLASDEQAEGLGLAEDEYELVPDSGEVDIAPVLFAAIAYDPPQVLLCSPDCKGLCPTCGANLNEGPCDCSRQDDIDETNPFSVLAGFFDEEE